MHKRILDRTPFGPVGIIWTELAGRPIIVRVLLSKAGWSAARQAAQLYPEARAASCPEIESVAGAIQAILAGNDLEIPLAVADLASVRCSSRLYCAPSTGSRGERSAPIS